MGGAAGDIRASKLQASTWDDDDTPKALEARYGYAIAQAERAITWYYTSKDIKRWRSRLYRFSTIVLTALGGLFPIAAPLLTKLNDSSDPATWNQIGYLCAGLAGLCLALDRFSGSSTGWMRYIATAMALETLLEQLRTDWMKLEACNGRKLPPPELAIAADDPRPQDPAELAAWLQTKHTMACLDRIGKFLADVRKEVETETQSWIKEFQQNLAQLEQDTKEAWEKAREEAKREAEAMAKGVQERVAAAAAAEKQLRDATSPGAIEVTLKSQAKPAAGFSVSIDGRRGQSGITGPTYGVGGIAPGLHEVGVTASIGSADLHASKVVLVEPNKIAQVTVELG